MQGTVGRKLEHYRGVQQMLCWREGAMRLRTCWARQAKRAEWCRTECFST